MPDPIAAAIRDGIVQGARVVDLQPVRSDDFDQASPAEPTESALPSSTRRSVERMLVVLRAPVGMSDQSRRRPAQGDGHLQGVRWSARCRRGLERLRELREAAYRVPSAAPIGQATRSVGDSAVTGKPS